MSWIGKEDLPKIARREEIAKRGVPEGLWVKCEGCDATLYHEDLEENSHVCPKCNYHMKISARARLANWLDPENQLELASEVQPIDPLTFRDSKAYPERLAAAQKATSETDALIVLSGTIKTVPVVVACFEFEFMGGSMGSVVGERFVRAVQYALEKRCAFVCVAASGGARMQEGLFSLMQMAKTNAILTQLSKAKLPFISVLTYPTMGGVSASFAFMGDVVLVEPGAQVGFTGPRVIEQTIREKLPAGFQRAEFLLQKGAVDRIVDRRKMRDELASLISMLSKQ